MAPKNKPAKLTYKDILTGLRNGNRRMLAKGITLAESRRKDDVAAAQRILEQVIGQTVSSVRVGITGVPGVGKSTFIETLGMQLIDQGHRVAVLAVDPSSPKSGGSILGDKTRMTALSTRDEAFIRPSPTSGTLGGVTRATRESMMLCEAAGYDVILVETVGVGQSEIEVASMVDFFMLLMLPGAGDSLQGIKKGIIEIADMLVINKADGSNMDAAREARREYEQALRLIGTKDNQILLCSALQGEGVTEVWQEVEVKIGKLKKEGMFEKNRHRQLYNWMIRMTEDAILQEFRDDDRIKHALADFGRQLDSGQTTPVLASKILLDLFWERSA